MMNNVQPTREVFSAVAILCVLAAWWMYLAGGERISPLCFLETALVASILAETFAKDECNRQHKD